jgi:hypothetical protein
MTFEERIDRLVERHEAFAESLELLSADVRQNSAQIAKLAANQASMMDAITRLAHIADIQDRRITRLEEDQP